MCFGLSRSISLVSEWRSRDALAASRPGFKLGYWLNVDIERQGQDGNELEQEMPQSFGIKIKLRRQFGTNVILSK